ncbi:MAG: hypothetical protein IKO92_01645 [Clostridia bacterium]|nr:hypothetical protein [Clostridia bacterium]MBR4661416.1 hypothetical protein [Clostridia bacterium]
MYIRNGLKTNLRAKGRTALFFALIFVLTFVMTSAAGILSYCNSAIKQCDREFRSVALIEYLGSEYPDADAADSGASEARDSIDFEKIGAVPGVRSVSVGGRDAFYIDGFVRNYKNPEFKDLGVIVVGNFGKPEYKDDSSYVVKRVEEVTEDDEVVDVYFDDNLGYTDENGETVIGAEVALVRSTVHEYVWYYLAIVRESVFSSYAEEGLQVNVIPAESGFVAEAGKNYVLHGRFLGKVGIGIPKNGVESFVVTSFEDRADTPYAEYGGEGSVPELFYEKAEEYEKANNYVFCEYYGDVCDAFVFQQGELYLKEGEYPAKDDPGGCVITADIASTLGLGPGDEFTASALVSDPGNTYMLTPDDGDLTTFTVRGIVKDTKDYNGRIWAVGDGSSSPFYGYTLATVSLENASAEDAVTRIRETLPEMTRVSLFDQGYEETVKSFGSVASAATNVLFVCAAGTLASLLLFAFVFVGRQSDSVKTAVSLGTPRGGIALTLLSGAVAVSGSAAVLGGVAGFIALPGVYGIVTSRSGGASRFYYSETSLGVSKKVTPSVSFSPLSAAICVLSVIAVSLVLCAVFLRYAYKKSTPRRGVTRVRTPEGKTSSALRGSPRYASLSIRRGGRGSLVVPILCAALTAVVIVLSGVFAGWQEKLDAVYDDSVISGHAVSTDGRLYSGLLIPIENVRELMNVEGVGKIEVSASNKYYVSSDMPEFAANGYGEERMETWKRSGGDVVSLNGMRAAKDFFFADPQIEWLEGWDESFLSESECVPFAGFYEKGGIDETYPAVLSESFMKEKGLSLGDKCFVNMIDDRYYESELILTLRIVGSYRQTGSKANIYVPLSCTVTQDALTSEYEFGDNIFKSPEYKTWYISDEEYAKYYMYNETVFSTCRFTVSSADSLGALRASLYEKDFTRVGAKAGLIRTTIVLEDASFIKLTETLGRYISMGRAMAVLISAMVTLIGFIVSWLMINGRKREFAFMRGFGAGRGRVFGSFFLEQAALCAAGCAVGCLAMLVTGRAGALQLAVVGTFALFYLLGCTVSILIIGKTKLMELLSNRE